MEYLKLIINLTLFYGLKYAIGRNVSQTGSNSLHKAGLTAVAFSKNHIPRVFYFPFEEVELGKSPACVCAAIYHRKVALKGTAISPAQRAMLRG